MRDYFLIRSCVNKERSKFGPEGRPVRYFKKTIRGCRLVRVDWSAGLQFEDVYRLRMRRALSASNRTQAII